MPKRGTYQAAGARCSGTVFGPKASAAKRTVFWLQHAVPHMWFLACCAARLVCRLAVLCICAHTCSLRWRALRAGCLLICSLLGTLSLAALRTGKWLGLASSQVWEQRRSVSRLGRAAVGQRSGPRFCKNCTLRKPAKSERQNGILVALLLGPSGGPRIGAALTEIVLGEGCSFGTRKIAKSPPETAACVTKCGRRLAIRMSRRVASSKVDNRAKCCVGNCVGHVIWGSWSSAFARAAAAISQQVQLGHERRQVFSL